MKSFWCFTIVILSFFILIVSSQSDNLDKPTFRIVAPQFMCRGKNNDIPAPPEITISFQTPEGTILKYRLQVFFELLGNFKGQQHTLSVWKSIRTLEKRVRKEEDIISLKNQMTIKNTELTPGVLYRFEITAFDELNRESDVKNFTIEYNEGQIFGANIKQTGSTSNTEVSLNLLGAEQIYGDVPIVIEANAIWCTATNDYYFRWSIIEPKEETEVQQYVAIRGKTLRIPSGLLRAGNSYTIAAEIIGSKDESLIAKATMTMQIIPKGFAAKIIPEEAMIGLQKTIDIRLILKDSDNTGKNFTITWACKSIESDADCDYFEPSTTEIQTISLLLPDKYLISAAVEINQKYQHLTSRITIDADIIAYGSITEVPLKPISPFDEFQLPTTIEDLVPNCFAEWVVVKEDGFAYFDQSIIPIGIGNITIRDVREDLLNELADYDNDTLTEDAPMVIPRKGAYPNWNGLESDVKYKFRLMSTCPSPIDDNNPGNRRNVTTYTDVIIETNGPPQGQPIEVEPYAGEALRTIFRFSAGMAKDKPSDYPLRYIIGYIFDGYVVYIAEFFESTVTRTDLPFSDKPIRPFYQICDSGDSCSEIIFGEDIKIQLNDNFTDIEFEYKMKFIELNMKNMELDASFGTALACVLTFKHLKDQTYYNKATKTIQSSIETTIKLIKSREIQFFDAKDILYFVKLSERILEAINVRDESIYDALLSLLDEFDVKNQKIRKLEEMQNLRIRKKREVYNNPRAKMSPGVDVIQTALSLLGKSNPDSSKVIETIEKHSLRYCNNREAKFPYEINSRIASLHFSKCTRNEILGTSIRFSFKNFQNFSTIRFSQLSQLDAAQKYCVVTLGINGSDSDITYDLIIYEMSAKNQQAIMINSVDDNQYGFLYEISLNGIENKNNSICTMKKHFNDAWDHKFCQRLAVTESSINCGCRLFGIFKAIYVPNSTLSEILSQQPTRATQNINPSPSQNSEETPIIEHLTTETSTALLIENLSTTAEVIESISNTKNAQEPNNNQNSGENTISNGVDTTNSVANSVSMPIELTTKDPIPATIAQTQSNSQNSPEATSNAPIPHTDPTKTIIPETNVPALTDSTTVSSTSSTTLSASSSAQFVAPTTQTPSIEQQVTTNSAERRAETSSTVLGYTSAILLIFLASGFGIFFYIAYKRRSYTTPIPQESEIANTIFRKPADSVRYARFYDEQNMNGQFTGDRVMF